jgi:hypothetical protein
LRIQSTAKPKLNFIGHHGFAPVIELPALRGAFANHVEHQIHVQPGMLAKGHGLGQALHQPGNANLVDHFGQLPCTRFTDARECLRKSHTHGLGAVKRGLVATAHHCQHAVFSPGLPA